MVGIIHLKSSVSFSFQNNFSEVKSLSHARLFATPWILACTKLPPPWDFQGKKYWSGLPFPSPKQLLYPTAIPEVLLRKP